MSDLRQQVTTTPVTKYNGIFPLVPEELGCTNLAKH